MRRKWIPGRKIKAIEGPEDCGCGVCVGDGGAGSMGALKWSQQKEGEQHR